MAFGKRNKMPSRDIGLSPGAGKGDADRTTNVKAFREGYAGIDFGRQWWKPGAMLGFFQRGRRLIKIYKPKPDTNPT